MVDINNPLGTTMHSRGGRAGSLAAVLDNHARGSDSPERFIYEAEVIKIDSVGGQLKEARNAPMEIF